MEISGPLNYSVSVGPYSLITSGVVHTRSDSVVRITVEDLNFDIAFSTDAEDKTARFDARVTDSAMRLNLINHNSPLGEGIFDPMELATFDRHKVYLTYYVNSLPLGQRSLQFAVYRKENGNEKR